MKETNQSNNRDGDGIDIEYWSFGKRIMKAKKFSVIKAWHLLTLSEIEFKHFVYSTAAFSKFAALKNTSPASFIFSLGSSFETVCVMQLFVGYSLLEL